MSELDDEIRRVLENAERFLRQERELNGEYLYKGDHSEQPQASSTNVKTKPIKHEPEGIDLFGKPASTAIPVVKVPLHAARPYPSEPWVQTTGIDELNGQICTCVKCSLGTTRTNFVFGVGNPHADIVVIGEAPGADEDAQGEPFVGRAGQLLNKILEAIRFKREEVFICNILKCRPPNNRDPLPEEVELCEPYLWKQLELIKPKMILCLGRIAGQSLLKTNDTLGSLRGKFFDYRGIKLMVTYHPAALLRNPNWKKPAWEDVQLFRKTYDEMKSKTE
jgi:uracil-DNA glycosylase family 4